MRDSWKGKNIDLSALTARIEGFFALKKFKTSLKKEGDKNTVIVIPQNFHGISERIYVKILGKPSDFTVEFVGGSFSRSLVMHAPLLSIILGGYLSLKGQKSLDKIDELEREFWKYVDETIAYLESSK
ncbi:MAG: hypothetical protein QXX08_10685 [Candidatus Bathyarchaeia archaeon]